MQFQITWLKITLDGWQAVKINQSVNQYLLKTIQGDVDKMK